MTAKTAKQKGYTHHGKVYGFSCYLKHESAGGTDIAGTNFINGYAIEALAYLDVLLYPDKDYFEISQGSEL